MHQTTLFGSQKQWPYYYYGSKYVVEVEGLLKTEKDPPYNTFLKCSKDGIGFDIILT